ncbi:hypothetical protein FGO68_gene15711 [Halteria grandinella]|uniref:C2HC/C3H-type domain-containing protein n=1 Tax=Halteria grandinella TaxID=5974 RepID=A0A8J8NFH0_HALGN|nr:hypothetical protein FGO68_gene15711 [Halteria grandinella]
MHRAQHQSFDQDPRQECELCFRRFNLDSFERHILICEKVFFKKRKAFDSLKQRTLGDEHYQMIEAAMQKFSYYNENVKLNTKWKIRSAQFRMAVQQAKNPGQMPIEQSNGDNRVQCPYCLKRFANETAERHVPLCERKTRDLKNKGGVKPNGKPGVKAMSSTQKGGAGFNKKL